MAVVLHGPYKIVVCGMLVYISRFVNTMYLVTKQWFNTNMVHVYPYCNILFTMHGLI